MEDHMETCQHHNVVFYAWQSRPDGSKFPLYNCTTCKSTITLDILELDAQGIPHPITPKPKRDQ